MPSPDCTATLTSAMHPGSATGSAARPGEENAYRFMTVVAILAVLGSLWLF